MKDLFDGVSYPESPGYKQEGTSKESAARIMGHARTLRGKVYAELCASDGAPDQIAARLGESVLSIRPRLSELVAMGLIEETGRRVTNASGHKASVYRAKSR